MRFWVTSCNLYVPHTDGRALCYSAQTKTTMWWRLMTAEPLQRQQVNAKELVVPFDLLLCHFSTFSWLAAAPQGDKQTDII